jgi:hypothetical protein
MKGLAALLLVVFLAGCASPTYQIGVNAYIKPGDAPLLAPPASFCVLENMEAKDPALEQGVKRSIETLLGERGHIIVPFHQAQYYLVFSYGQGPARTLTMPAPVYNPWVYPYYGGYWQPYAFAPVPYYPPAVTTVQDRWVLLNVLDGGRYREKGEFLRLWLGEARSAFTAGDLRSALNYLLVALFGEFGNSSRGARLVELEPGDFRVMRLGG